LADRDELLRSIAGDTQRSANLRAEAVGGLATPSNEEQARRNKELLVELLDSDLETLRREALRALRPELQKDEQLTQTVRRRLDLKNLEEELAVALGKPLAAKDPADFLTGGNAAAGRRVFFHARGPACFKCHTVAGRGGKVGPDLSIIARTMDRAKLADSLLQPSKEISPQFTNWLFLTDDGRQLSGMILADDGQMLRIGTAEGEVRELPAARIEQRLPQRISIMPAGLPDLMTRGEFRDLLAYLESLR
jgi:putative heme-binding domain-containing protein